MSCVQIDFVCLFVCFYAPKRGGVVVYEATSVWVVHDLNLNVTISAIVFRCLFVCFFLRMTKKGILKTSPKPFIVGKLI